ncbi:MAG TPA: VWA domain-containing protein [Acidimicrobiales bacterium]|nr:VWA domain-containing protein [Acidimicrobiales bacterium]
MTDPGVHRLGLLASAIAGRTLDVGPAGAGEPAWTDGTAVFVDPGAPPAERVRMVAVQATLLAAGSLDAPIVRQLARRPALARRYLAVEGHRALAASEDVLPPVVRPLVDPAAAARAGGPEASLALARSGQAIGDPPPAFGVIRPRRVLAPPEDRAAAAPDQVRAAPPPGEPLAELDDADADGRDLGQLLSSPVGGRGVLGRLLQRMLRFAHGPGGSGPAGAGPPVRVGHAGPQGHGTIATSGPAPAPGAGAAFAPQGRTYPEWDVHRRGYRPDWCTVHERDARPGGHAPLAMPDGVALRPPLARLGTGLDRTHRRPQGDDIDVDAAVEAWVAALAGSPPDEAVYVESLRRRRDLAVLVLLDVSGSAGEPGPGGRTVHEHQRAAAAALTTALHDLGDRVALYAFNSQGRRAVDVIRVKGFDDRLDGRVVRRLGGLVPGAYTRLGAAIRHGTALLEARGGTSRPLLLVLSDGFAYDHGYGSRYGEADARRALTEARRRGVGCLCVSVGAGTTPVALQRVFGTAAHAAVPTPDQLPGLIGPLFRAALRSAEAQRRTFQRTTRARAQLELDRRAS